MDLVSLGFLFVIVLLGGVSAFAADSLGWRIGKRRHSMFGMRPKHFARLVVTIAGALIPLFTILFLTSASEGVRIWITEGRRAAAELPGVVQERNEAQQDLNDAKRQSGDLRRQNDGTRRELDAKQRELNEQTRKLSEQKRLIDEQVARLGTLGPQVKSLTDQARISGVAARRLGALSQRVQSALQRTQAAYRQGQEDLRRIQGEIRVKTREIEVIQAGADRVAKDLDQNNRKNLELTNSVIQLTQSVDELRGRTNALNTEIATLTTARDEALRESETARTDLSALQVQVQGLQSARDNLQAELNAYKGDAQQTRTQALTFRARDELARLVVPTGASVDDARALVNGVLRLARIEAERRGALPTPAGVLPSMRAADLPERKIDGRSTGATEQIDRLAAQLAGRKTDSVLVAQSALNFFEGEAVALNLAAFPDPVVFRAGEVIAEGRLDSRRGDAGVYAQINEFLGTRVQGRAREAKLIPLRINGEETFGEVPPEQILEAIRVAGGEPRVYRLQAVAVGDIRAGDRLKVELRLR